MLRGFDKRPSEFRLREQLPNGQEVNLYFQRFRSEDDDVSYQWFVGFYIGSRKEANRWFNHRSKNKPKNLIKGDGSLSALKWALKHILIFVGQLNRNEELVIGWEDQKRKRAYQFLRRHGFIDYYDEDDEVTHLGMRNKKYWYLVDD